MLTSEQELFCVEGVYVGTYYTNQHIIHTPTVTVGIKDTSDTMTYIKKLCTGM